MREEQRCGLDHLEAVTALCRRVRAAHPTKGLYEAADFQWWWRMPRPTDDMPQLFWFDRQNRPEAAVIATQWADRVTLDPVLLPDTPREVVGLVMDRALTHAGEWGLDTVELEVDRTDHVLRDVLAVRGFAIAEPGLIVEAWIDADARPDVSQIGTDYRLVTRADLPDRAHHLIRCNGPAVAERLSQTSLYRPERDLVVVGPDGEYAGYGIFWYDPVTATGLVEPMRTEDTHQRKGLARHVLTAGLDRLARAGAERIKICFESDNVAASHLYLSVGFEPVKETDVYCGRIGTTATS